ncbi:DUF883 family protein [Pedosphaera parvula]|uniref:Uncharacterized protein n=1 Tax=Pedosphaera parvula (strain Ellin514) TaxID=320771 RepID=B9XEJ2_PEDPL|nr:hypothetical protein [Pedosphaera parvula]EEF61706.1 protein of unknown function DUF883 ElaB [Pedosphaera parvula Ellin514]
MQTDLSNGNSVNLQQLINDLKVVVNDGEALLKSGAAQLRQKAAAGAKATDENIRRNPYPSMGIVFGVGVLLGILAINLMKSEDRFESN